MTSSSVSYETLQSVTPHAPARPSHTLPKEEIKDSITPSAQRRPIQSFGNNTYSDSKEQISGNGPPASRRRRTLIEEEEYGWFNYVYHAVMSVTLMLTKMAHDQIQIVVSTLTETLRHRYEIYVNINASGWHYHSVSLHKNGSVNVIINDKKCYLKLVESLPKKYKPAVLHTLFL